MPIFNILGYTLTESFKNLTSDDKLINKRVRLFICPVSNVTRMLKLCFPILRGNKKILQERGIWEKGFSEKLCRV